MADNVERIVLEVDERGAATAVASANRQVAALEVQFARAGQTAEQRLLAKIATLQQRMSGDPMRLKELETLQHRVFGRIAENAEKAGAKVGTLGSRIRDGIQNPLQTAGGMAESFLGKIGMLGTVIGGTAAAIGGVAVVTWNFAKSLAELGDQTEDTAVRMGLSIRETEAFRFAMARAGGDLGQLEGITRKLSQEIENGGGTLHAMGVNYRDVTTGAVRPMSEVILEISRRLKGMTDVNERNTVAIKIMGRAALEVLPDLMELEAGVNRFNEIGVGISDEQVRRFAEYQKQIAELDARWNKLKISFKETIVATVIFVAQAKGPLSWLLKAVTPAGLMPGAVSGKPNPADLEMAETGGWGYGASMSRAGQRWQQDSIRRNDAAVAARTASTAEERLAAAKTKLDELGKALPRGVTYREDTFKDFDAQRKIVEGLKAEIEATKKLKEEQKALAESQKKVNEARFGNALDLVAGRGMYDRTKSPFYAESIEAARTASDIELGMRGYAMGRVGRSSEFAERDLRIARQGREVEPLIEERQAADQRKLAGMERELRLEEQLIQLRTGPGGEIDAIEHSYQARVAYAQKEFDINRANVGEVLARYTQEERLQDAQIDRIQKVLELERRRFDSLKDAASGLIDAAFERSQSAGQAFANMLKAMILTPVKEALSEVVAKALMPIMYGKDGRGGIMGSILGVFRQDPPLKISTDVNTLATNRNTVAVDNLTARLSGATNAGGGGSGAAWGAAAAGLGGLIAGGVRTVGGEIIGAGRAGNAGLERLPSGLINRAGIPAAGGGSPRTAGYAASGMNYQQMAGGAALMLGTGLLMSGIQKGGAGRTIGGGAAMGAGIGLMGGPIGAIGGAGIGLGIAGLQRGGWSGVGMTTAGGALLGFNIAGPLGAAIGAGAGFIAGLIRLGIKGATQKVQEKVEAAYRLKLDKGMAGQIVKIAKDAYGGNLDVAIRAPQVLELLQLYAMATGQQFGAQIKARPVSLVERGGGLLQNAIFENGNPLAYGGGLPVAGGLAASIIPSNPNYPAMPTVPYAPGQPLQVNLSLSPEQTLDVFAGKTVQVIQQNPRTVQSSVYSALRSNSGRRDTAAALLTPSTITS